MGINVFFGMFLAQLHTDIGPRANSLLPKFISYLTIILGLFAWSFPDDNHDWAPWSRNMKNFMVQITPFNVDIGRYWVSVGTSLTMLGIFFSRDAKRVLTLPFFNFLGRCSFPVYLIHNTLVRSVFVWMFYGRAARNTAFVDEAGNLIVLQRPSTITFVFMMPIFYALLYATAYLWTLHVDRICVRAVDWMRNLMFKNEDRFHLQEKLTPLSSVTTMPE